MQRSRFVVWPCAVLAVFTRTNKSLSLSISWRWWVFFVFYLYNHASLQVMHSGFFFFFTLYARCVCGTIPYITQALLPSLWTPAFPRWASCSSQFGTWTTLVASSSALLKAWRAWRRAPRPRRPSMLSAEHSEISIKYHSLKWLCQTWWKIKAFWNISIEMFMQCMKLFFLLFGVLMALIVFFF